MKTPEMKFVLPLARGLQGEAITTEEYGQERYLYIDGSVDMKSRVNKKNPAISVACRLIAGQVVEIPAESRELAALDSAA